jgi:hypothetical protein
MPRASPIQTQFNQGEFSPLMYGRVDFPKYKEALKTCLNGIPQVQGPWTRRPGFTFVNAVKDSTKKSRLQRFEFNTQQAYVLEFGNTYTRFYSNHGIDVVSGTTPVELVTPYLTADLFNLQFTQSTDTLYPVNSNYPPSTIARTSATTWTYNPLVFTDGPYLDTNTTATTLTMSGGGNPTTVTASSVAGINNGAGFGAGDVGRVFRYQISGSGWVWGTVSSVTNSTTLVANVVSNGNTFAGATAIWRLGAFYGPSNYPAAVTFYQDRLCFGGCPNAPETCYMSSTGDYVNFAPTAYDVAGTVANNNSITFTLNSNDVQVIRWLSGDANGLLVGTLGGEWAVTPNTLGGALSPSNLNAVQMTAYGEAQMEPVRIGYKTLALQRSLRKLREISFVYYENRYHAPDLTVPSQHITYGGITQMAYQQEPNSILWLTRNDGTLVGFTYEQDQNVNAWHRHTAGGVSNNTGANAIVESVATIPSPDGTRDELWAITQRWINGAVVRQVEYMNKIWETGDSQITAVYFDAALTYNGAPAQTISGFTHLAGETISILADGAVHPDVTVSNDGLGTIVLLRKASVVTGGYDYNSDGETLRWDAGSNDGTAQGKTKRQQKVAFRLLDSLGIQVGPDFDSLTPRINRSAGDPMGQVPPLFTGDDSDTWEGDYSFDDNICWRFNSGLPGTVEAIMPQEMTNS